MLPRMTRRFQALRRIRLALPLAIFLAMAPFGGATAAGEPAPGGLLERANRSLFDLNRSAGLTLSAANRLPSLEGIDPGLRAGAANLIGTWLAEPWQALALAAAGRTGDARLVLDRVATNITEGQAGLRDLASERGMPRGPQADMGLALCARGVPEGPYLVLPIIGGRTLRDGLTQLVIANALLHGSLLPFGGGPPSLDLLVAAELLDRAPGWAMTAPAARTDERDVNFEMARAVYLAGRREACQRLRAAP